jgi:hypothetical protein
MDRPIFLISNYSRKPEFQTQTRALKEKSGAIVFQKVALNESALQHLSSIKKTSEVLVDSGLGSLFCKATSKDNSIVFERIKGENFENLLFESVLQNDTQSTHKILDEHEAFLKRMVASPKHTHKHSYSQKIFGPGFFDEFSNSTCIYPGVLDLNFDNIIKSGSKLMAIDYEWAFGHCLPYDYVLARTIMWFGIRYADIFRMHSKHISVTALSDEIVLPSTVLDRYAYAIPMMQKAYLIEWNYFQRWVNSPFKKTLADFYKQPVVYASRTPFAIEDFENQIINQARLIEELNAERANLSKELSSRDEEISRLNNVLRRYPHRAVSKTYRVGGKVKRSVSTRRKQQK